MINFNQDIFNVMPSDYDKRQLKLMREKIIIFDKNKHSLSSLFEINTGLEGLLATLENIGVEWKEQFNSERLELELISSLMIVNHNDRLTDDDQKIISEVISNMNTLLKLYLN